MSSGRTIRRDIQDTVIFLETEQEEVFETGGDVFLGGKCVELIRSDDGSLVLLHSHHETSAERFEIGGRTYVPPKLHPSILESLTLPTVRVPCGATMDIFRRIHKIFIDHCISDEAARLFAYYTFSTWFPELLPIAPCLVITGPRTEANMALELLSCVVRHGLRLGNINSTGFRSLPMHIQPTLLIGNLDLATYKMLSISAYPHAFHPYRDGLIDLYCAKVVYAGDGVADGLHGDGILKIKLAPSHGRLLVIDPGNRQTIAADLQSQLLDYRFKYVLNVLASDFDVPTFPSSLRILARALGSCIIGAPDVRADLVPLLKGQEELLRASRLEDPQCVVLEALINHCHAVPGASRLGVGEIAKAATGILTDRGETRKVEAKPIGNFLRMVGLKPKRDSQGYAVFLTDDVRRQIHRLACDHEVEAVGEVRTTCVHCAGIIGVDGDSEIAPT